jgi:hypothetical protein
MPVKKASISARGIYSDHAGVASVVTNAAYSLAIRTLAEDSGPCIFSADVKTRNSLPSDVMSGVIADTKNARPVILVANANDPAVIWIVADAAHSLAVRAVAKDAVAYVAVLTKNCRDIATGVARQVHKIPPEIRGQGRIDSISFFTITS